MVSKMVTQGWAEKDVALAMVGLSEAHMRSIGANEETDEAIRRAKEL